MPLRRRDFLRTTAALMLAPRVAAAQSYPSRPVRIVVGFVPGTGNDITARLIGQWLSDRLGRQFIVENRPGAASNLAVDIVARAVPDGYTLLSVGPATTINAALYKNLSFDFLRDIAPVGGTMRVPNVMVVGPSIPARTVPEFIAYAKANPGKINMATAGPGSTLRMFGELFRMLTGVSLTAVSYRGGAAAFVDLLSGQVQVMFGPLSESIGHIRSGELRALAVTSAARTAVLPDVPTVGESVPGYETDTWYGIGAPKDTPAEIVTMLNAQINAGLVDAKMKERFADLGGVPLPMSPAEFGEFLAEQTEKWAKVIAFAGIKPE
jgi:tripartite-type tricarboxylate transporter receptor subunit TctC